MKKGMKILVYVGCIFFLSSISQGATQNDSKELREKLHAALLMYNDRMQDARIQRTLNIKYNYDTGFPDSLMVDTQEWLVKSDKYKFTKTIRFPNAKQMIPDDKNFEFDQKEVFDGDIHKSLRLYQGNQSPRGEIGGNEPRSAMPVQEMLLGFNQKPYYGLLDNDKSQVYEEKNADGMFYIVKGELIPESNLVFEIWLSKEHHLYPAKVLKYLGNHIIAETTVTEWYDTDEGAFPQKIKDIKYHAKENKVTLEVEKSFTIPQWHPKIETDEFVLEFPPGTMVKDIDADKSYVIKPTLSDDIVFPPDFLNSPTKTKDNSVQNKAEKELNTVTTKENLQQSGDDNREQGNLTSVSLASTEKSAESKEIRKKRFFAYPLAWVVIAIFVVVFLYILVRLRRGRKA